MVLATSETSTVNVPGFDAAHGSLQVAMAEAFGMGVMENKQDTFFEQLDNIREAIKPGKYKTKDGETITVHSVSGNKATISGDDAKQKQIDVDALKNIIVTGDKKEEECSKKEETFFSDLNKTRENMSS